MQWKSTLKCVSIAKVIHGALITTKKNIERSFLSLKKVYEMNKVFIA
jgi:hypothetical protein